jgi:hypothetical protein
MNKERVLQHDRSNTSENQTDPANSANMALQGIPDSCTPPRHASTPLPFLLIDRPYYKYQPRAGFFYLGDVFALLGYGNTVEVHI